MAGYWPSSFFPAEVHKLAKKNKANIQPSWLNKLGQWRILSLIRLSRKFFLHSASSPKRARWLHLACSGSQSQCVIWFILPTRGASHIIRCTYKSWRVVVPKSLCITKSCNNSNNRYLHCNKTLSRICSIYHCLCSENKWIGCTDMHTHSINIFKIEFVISFTF